MLKAVALWWQSEEKLLQCVLSACTRLGLNWATLSKSLLHQTQSYIIFGHSPSTRCWLIIYMFTSLEVLHEKKKKKKITGFQEVWNSMRWGTSLRDQGHRIPGGVDSGQRNWGEVWGWMIPTGTCTNDLRKSLLQHRATDPKTHNYWSFSAVPKSHKKHQACPAMLGVFILLNLPPAEISTYWFHLTQSTSCSHIIWAFCVLQPFFSPLSNPLCGYKGLPNSAKQICAHTYDLDSWLCDLY